MRYRKKQNILGKLLLMGGSVLLSACNSALLNPKGYIAQEQRTLILTAFCLMLIVVIPAILMSVIFAWKYRARNIHAKYSPDWSHSTKVEIVIWTIPVLIIIFLGILTWKSTHALDPARPLVSEEKPIDIEVISLDWKWLFIYPEQGIATINEIAFPVNTPVRFKVTSNSVMNSFFIPTLGSQIYAMAGMQTKLHLIASEPGSFDGISASYSGKGFSGMKFKAIATQDKAHFDAWVTKVKQAPDTLMTLADFEKLAIPSENHPVEYFSTARADLFRQVIDKFAMKHGEMTMPGHQDMEHSAHHHHVDAGTEE